VVLVSRFGDRYRGRLWLLGTTRLPLLGRCRRVHGPVGVQVEE
jgi:hypothetical protein